MTYSSAVEYLYGLQKHGIKLGLHNIQALLARLGQPQRRYRTIHIGGNKRQGINRRHDGVDSAGGTLPGGVVYLASPD